MSSFIETKHIILIISFNFCFTENTVKQWQTSFHLSQKPKQGKQSLSIWQYLINDLFSPLQILFHFASAFQLQTFNTDFFFYLMLFNVSLSESFALYYFIICFILFILHCIYSSKRKECYWCVLTLLQHERNTLYSIPTKTEDLSYWHNT